MNNFELGLTAQLCLAIGFGGLLWPERLMPVFDVLMFPWPASYRGLRTNSLGAIGLAVLLFVRLILVK